MLFLASQAKLDCINDNGVIIGHIKFDTTTEKHMFYPDIDAIKVSNSEQSNIDERLSGLDSGKYLIPPQDDD